MRASRPLNSCVPFLNGTRWRIGVWLGLVLHFPAMVHAQGTEIVRGKVSTADGKPIPDVSVTITGLTTQDVKTARTNDKGIFLALFANAEGDYLINVRKIGFSPYNTRLTRVGLSSVLTSDVTLKEVAFELDPITVLARRVAARGNETSVGGVERDLLTGARFSLDARDLMALAGQMPGIFALGDSGFSVLGAGRGANNTTIDGARFGGGILPLDAVLSARVIETSADPRVGNFSGGQVATILKGGSDVFAMTARVAFADERLAWTDPNWPSPVPRMAASSGTFGGPIVNRRLRYQGSWNVGDYRTNTYSFLDPPQAILAQFGVTLDTISAISHTLTQLGVPLTTQGFSDQHLVGNYNTSMVLDPYNA